MTVINKLNFIAFDPLKAKTLSQFVVKISLQQLMNKSNLLLIKITHINNLIGSVPNLVNKINFTLQSMLNVGRQSELV